MATLLIQKHCIFFFFLFSFIPSFCQEMIIYDVPSDIQKEAQALMDYSIRNARRRHKTVDFHFGFLLDSNEEAYCLLCLSNCRRTLYNDSLASVMATDLQTNRYLRIRDRIYPLYTKYDEYFCETEPSRLQRFGCRYGGSVIARTLLFDGHTIKFDKGSYKLLNKTYSKRCCRYNRQATDTLPTETAMPQMLYFFSDEVEKEIWDYFCKNNNAVNSSYSFVITTEGDYFRLYFVPPSEIYSGNPFNLLMTNRVMIVNDKYFPLYFDFDFLFGTPFREKNLAEIKKACHYIDIHRYGWFLDRKRT